MMHKTLGVVCSISVLVQCTILDAMYASFPLALRRVSVDLSCADFDRCNGGDRTHVCCGARAHQMSMQQHLDRGRWLHQSYGPQECEWISARSPNVDMGTDAEKL